MSDDKPTKKIRDRHIQIRLTDTEFNDIKPVPVNWVRPLFAPVGTGSKDRTTKRQSEENHTRSRPRIGASCSVDRQQHQSNRQAFKPRKPRKQRGANDLGENTSRP